MSLPKKMIVKCTKCGAEIEATVFESVNTDYAPDITKQIISGELFSVKCERCGFASNLEYDILYHDIKHRTMIWVGHDNLPEYATKVSELKNSANILGYKNTRIVKNMNELRQKVACLENGRDDKIVELCKVFITYNLLAQQPEFEFNNAFYTNYLGKEWIFLYDKEGQELACELTDNTYSMLYDMYYNSEYASKKQEHYEIVDYDWAENILQLLLKQEAEKIDAKNAVKLTVGEEPIKTEKKVICPRCNQMLPDDSEFCHYCGTPIVQQTTVQEMPQVNSSKNGSIYTSSTINVNSVDNMCYKQSTSKKTIIAILVIVALMISLIYNIIQYKQVLNYQHQVEYEYCKDCIAYVNDGSNNYHQYDCSELDKSSFHVYSVNRAKEAGYLKCIICH